MKRTVLATLADIAGTALTFLFAIGNAATSCFMRPDGSVARVRSITFGARSIALALLTSALVGLNLQPAMAAGTDVPSGIITSDQTWTLTGSPYRVASNVQIPQGRTIRIEAGVEVQLLGSPMSVKGSLIVAGSVAQPARISAPQRLLDAYASTNGITHIDIDHAVMNVASLNAAHDGHNIALTVSDSVIDARGRAADTSQLPDNTVLERNVIYEAGGFHLRPGTTILNNRFRGTQVGPGGYLLHACLGGHIHGNAFEPSARPGLIRDICGHHTINAESNHWASESVADVESWMLDADDHVALADIVVEPLLTAPPAAVPAIAPDVPRAVVARAGVGTSTITWTAPASDGGSPISGYTVTVSPGGVACTTTSDFTCTVTGLAPGTRYRFSVTASNAIGASSAASVEAAIPYPATVVANQKVTFRAYKSSSAKLTASGGSGRYSWAAVTAPPIGLRLPTDGRLTGKPTKMGTYTFTARASSGGHADTAVITVSVLRGYLQFNTSAILPSAVKGRSYIRSIAAVGGYPNYRFSRVSGTIPRGMYLAHTSGRYVVLKGTPTVRGTFSFKLKVVDQRGTANYRSANPVCAPSRNPLAGQSQAAFSGLVVRI